MTYLYNVFSLEQWFSKTAACIGITWRICENIAGPHHQPQSMSFSRSGVRPRLCISNKFPGIGDVAGLEAPAVTRRIRNGVLNIRFPCSGGDCSFCVCASICVVPEKSLSCWPAQSSASARLSLSSHSSMDPFLTVPVHTGCFPSLNSSNFEIKP